VLDRLETWRTAHITLGVLVLLPFWWHVDAGRATMLERALFTTVVLVVLSGLFGVAIHDLLPRATRIRLNQELRREDVEAGFHQLYVEAEEAVLGHSENLVHAYLRNVRPFADPGTITGAVDLGHTTRQRSGSASVPVGLLRRDDGWQRRSDLP